MQKKHKKKKKAPTLTLIESEFVILTSPFTDLAQILTSPFTEVSIEIWMLRIYSAMQYQSK